jgi:hypothetical protein
MGFSSAKFRNEIRCYRSRIGSLVTGNPIVQVRSLNLLFRLDACVRCPVPGRIRKKRDPSGAPEPALSAVEGFASRVWTLTWAQECWRRSAALLRIPILCRPFGVDLDYFITT